MTIGLLLTIKKIVFSSLALGMLLLFPVRVLVFKRQHWIMFFVSTLTCLSFIYLAVYQFMTPKNHWALLIVISEILLDAIIFWRISFPLVQQTLSAHKEMLPAKLTAEKIGLAIVCFIVMTTLSLGFVIGFLHQ